jgi:predicted flap endonuclease-1-like 5' DNA nuclease
MTVGISKIRGMQPALAKKFKGKSITNSEVLLGAAKTPKARRELAASIGETENKVLELANRADLARVVGIGEVFSNMLEIAGVDTVLELSKRKPENLHAKLAEVNAGNKYAKRDATLAEVTDWINQAKKLPRMLNY